MSQELVEVYYKSIQEVDAVVAKFIKERIAGLTEEELIERANYALDHLLGLECDLKIEIQTPCSPIESGEEKTR